MKEFVVGIDHYKYSMLDPLPAAPANQCILLYREGFDQNNSMVIDSYTKPMKADLRKGKFNKIAYLSMQERSAAHTFQIAMKESGFNFNARVEVRYSLKNVRRYFFEESGEDGDDIKRRIRSAVRSCDRQFSMDQTIDLTNRLQSQIEGQIDSYHALRVSLAEVSVEADADAQAILDSNKSKEVRIRQHGNETEVIVSQNADQEKINDSENRLAVQNIQYLLKLASQFGMLAPIFAEFSKGNLNGVQLYQYIDQNRLKQLDALKDAADNQLLSMEEVGIRASQIFNDSIGVAKQPVQIERKSEDQETPEDQEIPENVIVDSKLEDGKYI